jgi:hypothetical protein
MKKLCLLLVLAMCLGVMVVGPVQADPITVGDPLWYEFAFGTAPSFATNGIGTVPSSGGNSQFAPDPAWTFDTGAFGSRVTVVDAFIEGDIFTLYDFGVPMGSTTFVANTGNASGTSDPVVALTDFDLSRGFFSLGPGAHSLTIEVVQNALGVPGGGAAFFRVDLCPPVPVPPTAILLGSGLLGLVGLRFRKNRG